MSIQLPECMKCKTYGSFYQQHKILAFQTVIKNVNHKLTMMPKTFLRHLIFKIETKRYVKHPFFQSCSQENETQIFIEFPKFCDQKEKMICSFLYAIMIKLSDIIQWFHNGTHLYPNTYSFVVTLCAKYKQNEKITTLYFGNYISVLQPLDSTVHSKEPEFNFLYEH